MRQGLLEDADQTVPCLRCGWNSTVFVAQPCEHMKTQEVSLRFLTHPFVPAGFCAGFGARGHSLMIEAPVLSSAQCQTIPGKQGGQSSCDGYKVAEGTVYFSWSAPNKRAANSNKSQLCKAAIFTLWWKPFSLMFPFYMSCSLLDLVYRAC